MRNLFTLTFLLIHFLQPASAQSIYYQDFNGASFPAGWTPSDSRVALSTEVSSAGEYTSSATSPPASGGNNVRFNHCGPNGTTVSFTVNGVINTSGLENIRVGFGLRKSAAWAEPMAFEWSSDGSNWNLISSDVSAGATISWSTAYFDLPPSADDVTNLRFRFSFVSTTAVNCTAPPNFRIDDFIVGANASLPVELAAFEARLSKRQTLLDWHTFSETNNSHFLIERSPDGRHFTELGRIKGAGTIREPKSYSFIDPQPLAGTNYYRLRQVDLDGHYAFSPVKLVLFGDLPDVRLYPSPVQDQLNLVWAQPTASESHWTILSSTGQRLLDGHVPIESKAVEIPVVHLPRGAYFLQINTSREVWTQPFVKMND